MDLWLLVILSLFISTTILLLLLNYGDKRRLPPGPPALPLLGNLFWLRRTFTELEPAIREFHARYGPIVTIRIGHRPSIFISDRALAHKALVEHGSAFSDRPAPLSATRFISANQHNISASAYGPLWRLLRRNLISEILHPSRVKIYGDGRAWVLGVLIKHLNSQSDSNPEGVVVAMQSFQFAMFCLLVLMCFGEKLDEKAIKDIEKAQRSFLLYAGKLNVLAFLPKFSWFLFRKRIQKASALRQRQRDVVVPLIEARRKHKQQQHDTKEEERFVYSYVDSLFEIELPEEGRRQLTEEEMLVLCSEFLNAGTDTTSTALQWIMANLVKHQDIQEKLFKDIEAIVGSRGEEVKEEDCQKMPYLKAVIMEALRRHPPGHFVLPHRVTDDVSLDGYLIPKGATINFLVAEIGKDEKVWEDPLEFKPERFLAGGSGEGVDITGSREIKMMPFGVGRRICPGLGLAMLHLEYFVANLVRQFEWKAVEGEEVDMSEKFEFTVVMKHPLRAQIIPRMKKA